MRGIELSQGKHLSDHPIYKIVASLNDAHAFRLTPNRFFD